MKNPLVLTLDFGTQSVRAGLFDKEGNIVGLEKKIYEPAYVSPKKGYGEQEADFYWDCCVDVLKRLTKNYPDKLKDIAGATVTTFRDSAVALDKDGKPLRPVILWLDQRLAEAKEKVPKLYMLLFTLVGMRDTVILNRRRTMAHWIKENQPEIWAKTDKYVSISTYLNYKLTGVMADTIAGYVGHYPSDHRKRKWFGEKSLKGCMFGIPKRMLCELKQPGDVIGTITDEIADMVGLPHGINLYGTGPDKGCETIGVGALDQSIGAVSYGTACTIEVSNKKYHEPEPFLPAYAAAVPDWYNMEVQIYRGYWMLKWFSREFGRELIDEAKIQEMAVEEILNKGLEDIPAGCDGLMLQPYWGPGLARPLAKGAVIGFSDTITRNHFYRAIIEGIAFALREGLESIERSQKHKVKEIRISGGGSKAEVICQITADIFNLPVKKVQTEESTSLGAAIATFVALKEFDSTEEAIKSMVHVVKTYEPNPEDAKTYNHLFKKVYLNMYPKMKYLYKRIKEFSWVK
ncbi:MAG: FGGY-family carbohydrate kinase [Bacilli bacterium]|nr:FGGY-family carbohydrate kinase [Bacilli bacterium]